MSHLPARRKKCPLRQANGNINLAPTTTVEAVETNENRDSREKSHAMPR